MNIKGNARKKLSKETPKQQLKATAPKKKPAKNSHEPDIQPRIMAEHAAVRGLLAAKGAQLQAQTIIYIHGIGNKPPAAILKCQCDNALFGVDLACPAHNLYKIGLQPLWNKRN